MKKRLAPEQQRRAGRYFAQQKRTIGLDLGDRNSWYCMLDEAESDTARAFVSADDCKSLCRKSSGKPCRTSRIALEIGTHSPWIQSLAQRVGA